MNRPDRLDIKVDHYKVLGVARSVDVAVIRKAYLVCARRYHPDRQGLAEATDSARSQDRMRQVNEAWRILGDKDLKKRYDAGRRRSVPGASSVAVESTSFRPATTPSSGFKVGSPGVAAAVQYGPWVIALFAALAVFVFTAYATTAGGGSDAVEVDNWVIEGECISLFGPGNFTQAACDEPNDGLVVELRSDESCQHPNARAFEPRARAVVICLVRPNG